MKENMIKQNFESKELVSSSPSPDVLGKDKSKFDLDEYANALDGKNLHEVRKPFTIPKERPCGGAIKSIMQTLNQSNAKERNWQTFNDQRVNVLNIMTGNNEKKEPKERHLPQVYNDIRKLMNNAMTMSPGKRKDFKTVFSPRRQPRSRDDQQYPIYLQPKQDYISLYEEEGLNQDEKKRVKRN